MWFKHWSMYRDEGFFSDSEACGEYRVVCRYTDQGRSSADNLVHICPWSIDDTSPNMGLLWRWWVQEMLPNGDSMFVCDEEG